MPVGLNGADHVDIELQYGEFQYGDASADSLSSDSGQSFSDTHPVGAAVAPFSSSEGQVFSGNHGHRADAAPLDSEEDDVQTNGDTLSVNDVVFFATSPLVEARKVIRTSRKKVEKELSKLAMRLPVYESFVDPLHGFGALGFAQIVGEAGDLAKYSNPAKLWKRMGLAVINGKSQRRVSGAAALEQGYSPVRRSIMFCIGESLLKKQNAYKEVYDARKQFEIDKAIAAGLIVRPKKKGDPRNDDPPGVRTNLCIHRRAQRYAEKRLLRNLWRAWRDQVDRDTHSVHVSPSLASISVEV